MVFDAAWADVGVQVIVTAGAAYAGVSARLARTEERAISAAAMAAGALSKAEKVQENLTHHVELFHTNERIDRVR